MYDWNDLKYFLELSRQGKLVRAAARLQVDHTTVSRRIAALEKQLDVRLFDKSPIGYQLTDPGLRLLPLAEQIETRCNGVYQESPARMRACPARCASPRRKRSARR